MVGLYSKLGELLVQRGTITNLQLQVALAAQHSCRKRLGEILVERGFATEYQIAEALAEQYGYAFVDAATLEPTSEALQALDADVALRHLVLPVAANDGVMYCVICDPLDVYGTDVATLLSGRRIQLAVATEQALKQAIRSAYGLAEENEAHPTDVNLPERFAEPRRRRQVGAAAQFDAVDTVLHRPVTLIGEPSGGALRERAQRVAAVESQYVPDIYDYFEFDGFSWAVLPRLDGDHLAHALKSRGARSTVESAQIVAQLAEVCDAFQRRTGGCGLVTADNVMITASGACLVPFSGQPVQDLDEAAEISTLGALLRTCMLGSASAADAERRLQDSPKMLRETLERCDPSHPNAFAAVIQVAQALASCTWHSAGSSSVAGSQDREALLDEAVQVKPAQRGFWARLFGGQAKEAA